MDRSILHQAVTKYPAYQTLVKTLYIIFLNLYLTLKDEIITIAKSLELLYIGLFVVCND
jgi:hypothetical protein